MLVSLALVFTVALAAFWWYASQRRPGKLAAWASAHGLSFRNDRIDDFVHRYPDFTFVRVLGKCYACNVIEGNWNGRTMLGFDYRKAGAPRWYPGGHNFSGVILQSNVALRPLLIQPAESPGSLSDLFGVDHITFESAEFSRQFLVKAADRRWAYDVIHPRVMQFLLDNSHFSIQFGACHVICYRFGRFKPSDFTAACRVAAGLLDRLPEYVVRQQGQLYDNKQGEA